MHVGEQRFSILSLLVYPAILFAVAAVMIVALAVYLRLSGQLEARLDDDPVRLANGRRPDRRRNE